MERGEVHRHVGPEILDHPAGHGVELLVGVVVAGDDQVRDLHPDVRLVDQVLQGVEDVAQVRAAEAEVELLGERLEVDVRGVDVREELDSGSRADVPRSHCDGADPELMARVGDVAGVLEEDHGVVVGERDAPTPEVGSGASDRLGHRRVGERVDLLRLRDVPVLAEATGEVAAGGTERQHR